MFQRLFKKISGGFEKGHINRDEFITLVRTITKNLSDIKCIEIFNHFTKKNEAKMSRVKPSKPLNCRCRNLKR